MTTLALILTAIALSMDAVAVSLCCGLTSRGRMTPWQMLRVGLCFGGFQALMPALGFLLGQSIHRYIAAIDHWVAFGLLAFIGGRMLWEQWKNRHEPDCPPRDLTKLSNLLLMSIATSIDALAVGLGLAMTEVKMLPTILTIGVVTFVLCMVAILVGRSAKGVFARYANVLGGLILVIIGTTILIEHLGGAA